MVAALAIVSVAAFSQNKFAHVDFNELVTLMPEADEARNAMNASSKEAQETYQSMVEEFNKKYTDYQQKAQNASLSNAVRESKEKELTEIQQRIQQFEQSVQQELAQQQEQLMAPIYKKAQEVVEKLAKDGGYIYVFQKSSVLYLDPAQSKDLTPAARKALNIPDDRTMESLQAELQAQAEQMQQPAM